MSVEGRLAIRMRHLDDAVTAASLLGDLLGDNVEVVALDLTQVVSAEADQQP